MSEDLIKCFYINLDNQVKRRDLIESNFNETKKTGWTLTRLPAFDALYVENLKFKS